MQIAKKYLLLLILMQVGASVQDTKTSHRCVNAHTKHKCRCTAYLTVNNFAGFATAFPITFNFLSATIVTGYPFYFKRQLTTSFGRVARSSYIVVTVLASASKITASPRSCLRTNYNCMYLCSRLAFTPISR